MAPRHLAQGEHALQPESGVAPRHLARGEHALEPESGVAPRHLARGEHALEPESGVAPRHLAQGEHELQPVSGVAARHLARDAQELEPESGVAARHLAQGEHALEPESGVAARHLARGAQELEPVSAVRPRHLANGDGELQPESGVAARHLARGAQELEPVSAVTPRHLANGDGELQPESEVAPRHLAQGEHALEPESGVAARHLAKGAQELAVETRRRTRRRTRVLVIAAVLVFLGAPSALAVSEFRTATSAVARLPRVKLATTLPAQIPVLLYHGIGTPSPVTGSVGNYNVTLKNFKANMAALAKAGYATVTPRQYVAWLSGINLRLPAKPVLITFDDAFWSDTFATPIMARYGFHAVMFVVTGYADQLYGTEYAPWTIVSAMSKEGWYLQLHAGECGHAFLPDAPGACLKGLDRTQVTTSQYEDYIWNFGQTDAQYETRVVKDIKNGLADLASHAGFVKGWRSQLFAAPFGAWSNGENPWLDSYWDSQFDVIFTQQITTVDQAAAKEYHVRYRLELGEGAQSARYLMSNIENTAFTRAGTTGTVGNAPTRGSG